MVFMISARPHRDGLIQQFFRQQSDLYGLPHALKFIAIHTAANATVRRALFAADCSYANPAWKCSKEELVERR